MSSAARSNWSTGASIMNCEKGGVSGAGVFNRKDGGERLRLVNDGHRVSSTTCDVHSHLLRTEKRWKWNGCKRSTCYVAMLTW